MTLTHMWSGNFQRQKGKRERRATNNYASLSDPGLARVHRIPFVLGLPTTVPVMASLAWNNGGFLFIAVSLMCFIFGPSTALLPYLQLCLVLSSSFFDLDRAAAAAGIKSYFWHLNTRMSFST